MAVDDRNQETNIYNDNYRTQYPPAQVGESAYRRATARNLEESRIRSQQAQSSYSEMYNRSRQGSYRNRMAGAPQGFTGGMRSQYENARSAAEMQAFNQIGVQQERELRDIDLNRLAMDRQAVQEAYQAEDRARQTTAYNMQLEQQRQAILANEEMTDEQKMRMMMSSGMDYATAAAQVNPSANNQGVFRRAISGEAEPLEVATNTGLAVGGTAMAVGAVKSLPTLSKLGGLVLNPGTRYSTTNTLKKLSYKTIMKGSVSIFGKGSGVVAGKTVSKAGTKMAAKYAFKLPKVAGVLAKFAVAHPVVAAAVATAAIIGAGYAIYQRQTQKNQTTDYSAMMPAMG